MSATLHDAPTPGGTAAELRRGWRALTAATVGIGTGVAVLPFYTNGLFVPELEAEFGWSRGELSALQLVGSLVIVLTAPIVGVVIDRYGVRVPATLSLLALGGAYFLLAASGPAFAGYLLVFGLMYVLAAASTPVSFTRAVNERFDRARGLALGTALGGAGLVAFLVPQLLGATIDADWRGAYRVLGVAVLTGAVVVAVVMPGRAPVATGPRATAVPIAPVLRTALFARLAAAFAVLALAVGGLTLHLVPLLRDAGVPAASAAATAGLVGIAVIVGRVSVGLLVDRFFAPRVAAAVLAVAAAGYLALLLGGPGLAAAAALGVGLALGAEVDLIGYLTARYFGLARYGRLFGVFYAVFTLGVGASPLLMAWLRSATGGYGAALGAAVALLGVAAVLLVTAPAFPQQEEARS
ncbi:nitrate/nitrite transporter NarK [Pseudonocardia hierapolitana]|uniref:Nitrate/nitrite transporter NarK n=1 Tax=Pseudonocardia hierapolitana TaxID=1128676 RepID=A0A561SJZ8_9PSEU|nr:MFS transporter [Pseudonocardia hierapolitana]TWF75164.1 nitrate/nitrite transporter NarK [Pseudonocardia hierapolitana]